MFTCHTESCLSARQMKKGISAARWMDPTLRAHGPLSTLLLCNCEQRTLFLRCSEAWGCGSNDGRCGVERFLNKKGDGKPPEAESNERILDV